MKYDEVLEYIDGISSYGIVPGLDSIKELCRRLGNPQEKLSFVHISGTNGKGSTLAYISTILKEAHLRVGIYISPVIFEYREKIQVNGSYITKKALGELMEKMKAACDEMVAEGLNQPTPFEVETALAFCYFVEKKCDIVVLETGMGGSMDATNLINNTLVAVIASIGMDHMQFLGNTIEEIACQKAGIIKKGCTCILMNQERAVVDVVRHKADEMHARLVISDSSVCKNVKYGVAKQKFDYPGMKGLEISLAGKYQVDNAVLAIHVIRELQDRGFVISDNAIRKGLINTVWEGRFTTLSKNPLFIVDGAHNEDAARKLAESIEFYFTNRRIIYIIGMLRDKECGKVISLSHKYADQIITVTPPNNNRAMAAYDLAGEILKVHPNVTAVDSLEEAVEMSYLLADRKDVIIAFGSLSYLGRLIELVRNRK